MLANFVRRVGTPGGAHLARIRLARGDRRERFTALAGSMGPTLTLYEVDDDDGVRELRRFHADPRSSRTWFLRLPQQLHEQTSTSGRRSARARARALRRGRSPRPRCVSRGLPAPRRAVASGRASGGGAPDSLLARPWRRSAQRSAARAEPLPDAQYSSRCARVTRPARHSSISSARHSHRWISKRKERYALCGDSSTGGGAAPTARGARTRAGRGTADHGGRGQRIFVAAPPAAR